MTASAMSLLDISGLEEEADTPPQESVLKALSLSAALGNIVIQ